MNTVFDKKRMFDNITFMLTELGKKIGELETAAGVSTGYISRTNKDSNTKPGIDFVVNVANALEMSMDTLLKINMSELTSTERYLVSFLEKLKRDTVDDKLVWDKESANSLNTQEADINGYVGHPLFNYETFFEQSESEYPDEISEIVMISHSFACHTFIEGDCFHLEMKNQAVLYIMNISKRIHNTNDSNAYAKEIWMYKPDTGCQFLYSNKKSTPLAILVDDLYKTVLEFSKHPKINNDLRNIIDSFMNDDNLDDDESIIPF